MRKGYTGLIERQRLTGHDRIFQKTTEYLDHFARFKRKENVEAVERLLSAHKELAKFERAQLGMSGRGTHLPSHRPEIYHIEAGAGAVGEFIMS